MENKKTDPGTDKEDKIGVIPVSQLEGSDADTAHQDNDAAAEQAKQATKSDSDSDEQTDKSDTD